MSYVQFKEGSVIITNPAEQCPSCSVLVQSRRMSLHGETGSFAEYTPAPHLRDWTGSFAEHTYKVPITLNVVVQLQLHCAPYPDLKPALLPRCPIPLHRPLLPPPPPSRLHPCTHDPLLPQYPILSKSLSSFSSALLLISWKEVEYLCAVASRCVFAGSRFWLWLRPGGVVFCLRLKEPYGAERNTIVCALNSIISMGWRYIVALGWMHVVALIKFSWIWPAEYAYMREHICVQSIHRVYTPWMDWSIHGGGVQGYTLRKNQSSHGGWDSVNGPVSPRRDILRDWTRTCSIHSWIELPKSPHRPGEHGSDISNCLWYVMEIEKKKLDE